MLPLAQRLSAPVDSSSWLVDRGKALHHHAISAALMVALEHDLAAVRTGTPATLNIMTQGAAVTRRLPLADRRR